MSVCVNLRGLLRLSNYFIVFFHTGLQERKQQKKNHTKPELPIAVGVRISNDFLCNVAQKTEMKERKQKHLNKTVRNEQRSHSLLRLR